MEEVDTQETWNKKRIIIAIILLILFMVGGYILKTHFLPEIKRSVEGISTEESVVQPAFRINIQEAVREKINRIKQDVSGLDVMEIASSSPQVQKILNDIRALEQYPTNQLKEICRKVCGL